MMDYSCDADMIQMKNPQDTKSHPEQAMPKPAWGGAGIAPIWGANSPCSSFAVAGYKSLKEVMSEDLAKDLQIKEEEKRSRSLLSNADKTEFKLGAITDTSNDLFLAQMLQYEYDKEYDNQLQREEKHLNKNCKLAVSFDKYKVCPDWYGDDSDEDDANEIDDENRALDSFEQRERGDPVIPPCGYIRHKNKIVTKHDTDISGRKNAERIMNFPPEFNTGDGGGFDMQLPNKVYNKLMACAINESRRKQRVHDKEERATSVMALDHSTRLIIYKMTNNSVLESVHGVISTGKESVVIHAIGGVYEDQKLPSECAIKVFKTFLTDFKTRELYIRDDYRFRDRMSKNNSRLTIQLWAEKEFRNLHRLQKAKIPSPQPLLIKEHVLLMSFIGDDGRAAPKLKNIRLSYEDWCIAYEQVSDAMVTMYQGCHLVHGDMSEYNILWHEDKCWIIDLGQAVEYSHPSSLQFLFRDCSNITGFFKSKGLTEILSTSQLFSKITGLNLPEGENADQLAGLVSLNERLSSSSNDHFEFLWNEIQKEESSNLHYLSPEYLPELEEEDEQISASVKDRNSNSLKKKVKKAAKTPSQPSEGRCNQQELKSPKTSKGKRKKNKGKKNDPNM